MADLMNQNNFNKCLSFFIGFLFILIVSILINENQIIIIENNNG